MDQYCCNNCSMQSPPALPGCCCPPPVCCFTDYRKTRLEPKLIPAWEKPKKTHKRPSKPRKQPPPCPCCPCDEPKPDLYAKPATSAVKPKSDSNVCLPAGEKPKPNKCDKGTSCVCNACKNLSTDGSGKSFEKSCADFLNIVHDSVKDTVEKSIECILKDYYVHTMDKIECLGNQMMRNECLLSKMYLDMLDRFGEQNRAEQDLRTEYSMSFNAMGNSNTSTPSKTCCCPRHQIRSFSPSAQKSAQRNMSQTNFRQPAKTVTKSSSECYCNPVCTCTRIHNFN